MVLLLMNLYGILRGVPFIFLLVGECVCLSAYISPLQHGYRIIYFHLLSNCLLILPGGPLGKDLRQFMTPTPSQKSCIWSNENIPHLLFILCGNVVSSHRQPYGFTIKFKYFNHGLIIIHCVPNITGHTNQFLCMVSLKILNVGSQKREINPNS